MCFSIITGVFHLKLILTDAADLHLLGLEDVKKQFLTIDRKYDGEIPKGLRCLHDLPKNIRQRLAEIEKLPATDEPKRIRRRGNTDYINIKYFDQDKQATQYFSITAYDLKIYASDIDMMVLFTLKLLDRKFVFIENEAHGLSDRQEGIYMAFYKNVYNGPLVPRFRAKKIGFHLEIGDNEFKSKSYNQFRCNMGYDCLCFVKVTFYKGKIRYSDESGEHKHYY